MPNNESGDLIEAIYEAATDASLWPDVLQRISASFGAEGVSLISKERPSRTLVSGTLLDAGKAYVEHWWKFDTLALRDLRSFQRIVTSDWMLLSRDVIRRDPFFQEFRRPYNLGHMVFFQDEICSGETTSLSLHLPMDVRALPEQATLQRFQSVGKHLMRAFAVSQRLSALEGAKARLESVLSELHDGIVLVDGDRKVQYVNPAFERLLGNGIDIRQGRLSIRSARDQAAVDRLLASASGRVADSPEVVAVPRAGGAPLLIRAVPLPAIERLRLCNAATESGVCLIAIDPDAESTANGEIALRALGLTKSEIRVSLLVATGRSAPEIAAILGKSPHTIRAQVKAALAKLGLSRQSELVRLVKNLSGVS